MVVPITLGAAELWHGDCAQLLDRLSADAVVTDPPYGIGYRVNARAFAKRSSGLDSMGWAKTEEREAIVGDNAPFDPTPWLGFGRAAFFGAQHFSHRLPLGRWLIWDKRRESEPDSHSDADLVWLTGDNKEALRVHRQKWRGVVREGEENCSRQRKQHPNQKPVALLINIMQRLDLQPGDTVLDPFMGSGSTGIAAVRLGLRFVGCEVSSVHFVTACIRISQELSHG